MKISVVTPVYNAVNIVDELYKQLVENVSRITDDFEIVMVNDACPYGSGEKIAALARKDSRVKFISIWRVTSVSTLPFRQVWITRRAIMLSLWIAICKILRIKSAFCLTL